MTDYTLSDLERMLKAATPGPWVALAATAEGGDMSDEYFIKAQPHPALRGFTKDIAMVDGEAAARYIAAANPSVILELIAEIEKARAKLTRWETVKAAQDGERHP